MACFKAASLSGIAHLPIMILLACSSPEEPSLSPSSVPSTATGPLFEKVPSSYSGVDFVNKLKETAAFNYIEYEYMYNGGGVGVGDLNNDQLPDLYFVGNQLPDRIFINKGDLKFEDITATAGIGSKGWRTGVSMVDINADGWLDLYVCRSGKPKDPNELRDLVFINNKDLTFTEQGEALGFTDTLHSTQSAFFDMDNDGDLDMYLLGHPIKFKDRLHAAGLRARMEQGIDTDILYRNDGGVFTNISKQAGIADHAFGLGVSISDLNADGYLDVFVSNDYQEPDILYMNNGDGTFTDHSQDAMGHMANMGMGCDVADVNNDGWMDIYSLDMAFETHKRSKTNMPSMSEQKFYDRVALGWHYQYMHNIFHLNHGNGRYSEIAQAVGLQKSDWSWAALWCDLDNDSWSDLFITNGYRRDMTNNDVFNKLNNMPEGSITKRNYLNSFPVTKLQNYVFQNNGDLRFQKVSKEWGFVEKTRSNGAAYADLDNDGDLDMVINNVDEEALIYKNRVTEANKSHWLMLDLKGEGGNRDGLGAVVMVKTANGTQVKELHATRGYQSSVDPRLHFGLGDAETVSEVIVDWPTGERNRIVGPAVDQILTVNQHAASEQRTPRVPTNSDDPVFKEISEASGLHYTHSETPYDDFGTEVLLPHRQSQHGPFSAVADVNGDGLDDVFVGGAKDQAAGLFIQSKTGGFSKGAGNAFHADRTYEDLGATFFDYDGDGDMDLYVCSGGVEFPERSENYQDRLYRNNGNGVFARVSALPQMPHSTGTVCAQDVDADGDLDLIVGGRNTPGRYPIRPRSFVLVNDEGAFTDATDSMAPDLKHIGMVTGLAFGDLDGDQDDDLVVVGEWMPVTTFENVGGQFQLGGTSGLDSTDGWWYSATLGDLDNDGDLDIVAGNLGANNKFHPTKTHPLHIYCNDFDENGTYDIVLAKYEGETCYPVRGKECSTQQMPFIAEKFPTFEEFATTDLENMYGRDKLEQALHLRSNTMRSAVFWNDGKGGFAAQELPLEAQFAPLNGTLLVDVDGDQDLDIVGGGNMYHAEVETTRYDAGVGVCLLNDGQGGFTHMPTLESGFFIPGDVKGLELIHLANGELGVVVTNNDAAVQLFKLAGRSDKMAQLH